MKSSYNNFLANIEVDEKDIKRELAKREIAKKKRQQYQDQQNKVRPKEPLKINPNGLNKRSSQGLNNKHDEERVSLKQGKDRVTKATNAPVSNRNLENRGSQNRSVNNNSVNNRSNARPRITQEDYYNIKQQENKNRVDNRHNPQREVRKAPQSVNQKSLNNTRQKQAPKNVLQYRVVDKSAENYSQLRANQKSNQNNSSRNSALSKDKLRHEQIHLRRKKIINAKSKDNVNSSNQVHLTMSKKEYDQKVLGTIRENSTRFILFRDSTRLARAPKGVAFLGFYTFVLAAIMLYFFSQVAVAKMELSKVNDEYAKLNEVNAQLNIKLATAYNIDNIRQRAENELYMSKPEPHQIMYITVVPENFVEYEMDTEESKKNE